jgi:hypothetical protein
LGEKSPIAAFLQKNSNGGIHHICIEVLLKKKLNIKKLFSFMQFFLKGK